MASVLADNAIADFAVNQAHMADLVDRNPIMVTALNPVSGYETGAKNAKRAYAEGRKVKDVAAEMTKLTPGELDRLLNPKAMTEGGIFKLASLSYSAARSSSIKTAPLWWIRCERRCHRGTRDGGSGSHKLESPAPYRCTRGRTRERSGRIFHAGFLHQSSLMIVPRP